MGVVSTHTHIIYIYIHMHTRIIYIYIHIHDFLEDVFLSSLQHICIDYVFIYIYI